MAATVVSVDYQRRKLPGPQMKRRQWLPTPVLLPGKSHGQRRLVGCSPWGCEEVDTPEQLHFHFSLSGTGEGNGNPLQCSGLENPRDGGAWWAAVYGVAQSRTRLKRLSSSSSRGKEEGRVPEPPDSQRASLTGWWFGGCAEPRAPQTPWNSHLHILSSLLQGRPLP